MLTIGIACTVTFGVHNLFSIYQCHMSATF